MRDLRRHDASNDFSWWQRWKLCHCIVNRFKTGKSTPTAYTELSHKNENEFSLLLAKGHVEGLD